MTNTNKKAIEILKKNRPSWGTRECDKELCWAVDTVIDALNAFENLGDFVTKFADSYDYALVAKDVWRDAKKALEEQGKWKAICLNCGTKMEVIGSMTEVKA